MATEGGNYDLLILQPPIRPALSGVTDHSLVLAEALRQHGVTALQLDITGPAGQGLAMASPARAVLLQFSPYGYEPHGVPRWLVSFMGHLRRRAPSRLWITYFHELWAVGQSVWRSAFWLQPWQRHVCLDVMAGSDLGLFNTRWAHAIGRRQMHDRARFMPTSSNVGEPDAVPTSADRLPALVVFGSARSRSRCYADGASIARFMERFGLDRIIDIGEAGAAPASLPPGIVIEHLGVLPPDAVSRWLTQTRFGLFEAPLAVASKSGVFAAYRAHGVVPVAAQRSPGRALSRMACDLVAGLDFIPLHEPKEDGPAPDGQTVHARYASASLSAQVALVSAGLRC